MNSQTGPKVKLLCVLAVGIFQATLRADAKRRSYRGVPAPQTDPGSSPTATHEVASPDTERGIARQFR